MPATGAGMTSQTIRALVLDRDEQSLNRRLIPFVPAEAGTQCFGRILGSWVHASAGTNGDWFNGGANLNSSRYRRIGERGLPLRSSWRLNAFQRHQLNL